MHIKIQTNHPVFGYRLAEALELEGHHVSIHDGPPEVAELRHRPGVEARQVRAILQQLRPLELRPVEDETLAEDLAVCFGIEGDFTQADFEAAAETPQLLAYLDELAATFGMPVGVRSLKVTAKGKLVHSAVPASMRQMLRWWLLQDGHGVVEEERSSIRSFSFAEAAGKTKPDPNPELGLFLRVHDLGEQKLQALAAVDLHTDDPEAMEQLSALVEGQGFRVGKRELLSEQGAMDARMQARTAWFGRARFHSELEHLMNRLREFNAAQGVNAEYYPLQSSGDEDEPYDIVLTLPLKACRERRRPAYAGSAPERFSVTIYADTGGESLQEHLKAAGFSRVDLRIIDEDDLIKGFRLVLRGGKDAPQVITLLNDLVRQEMVEIGAAADFTLGGEDLTIIDNDEFEVYFPQGAFADGSLREAMMSPHSYDLKIHCSDRRLWQSAIDELESWGFSDFDIENEQNRPGIHYGGAPRELVDKVAELFESHHGLKLKAVKKWSDSDDDIWVFLPKSPPGAPDAPRKAAQPKADLAVWTSAGTARASNRGPFLSCQDGLVAVGDLLLERVAGPPHPLVPRPEEFANFCVDARTAELLHHIATCILLGEPCLLEGETSTSKTSSIRFLCMHLNQPVIKLNLNGQTDTSDLIGRYVPIESAAAVESAGHRNICRETGEMTANGGWRWQHGLLVQAMRQGWGLTLDEVNNWNSNLLEILNPVLERGSSLVLKEYDNSVIGPGGVPVHPRFRIFATMNPAEYAGRVRLSPAFKDRWVGYRYVEPPGEAEYLAMLRLLVHGEQPPVTCCGVDYASHSAGAVHPQLADVPGIDRALESLARLQVALEQASRSGDGRVVLGQASREGIVITRRSLLGVIDYIANPLVTGGAPIGGRLRHALSRYYLGRARPVEDRAAMAQIFDSVGLGPNTWVV